MKYRLSIVNSRHLLVILILLLPTVPLVAQSGTSPDTRRLLNQADEALDYGQYVEAIELLIRADRRGSPEARGRLQELESSMSLQPASSWMDEEGHQIEGRLVDFELAEGLEPSVLATINLGAGQAAIADLPILFEAIRGRAELVSPVTTSEYGLANSRVLSVEDPYAPLVVRARVAFEIDGRPYRFGALERDFSYRPLSREASLVVIVVDGDDVRYQDRNSDRIAGALAREGVSFVSPERLPAPSALLGPEPGGSRRNSPGPDASSPARSATESVIVVVTAEVLEATQVTLGDRVFDIWQAEVSTSYRVLRTEDRRLLVRVPGPRESGQGATQDQAIAGAVDRAMERLEDHIERSPGDYAW